MKISKNTIIKSTVVIIILIIIIYNFFSSKKNEEINYSNIIISEDESKTENKIEEEIIKVYVILNVQHVKKLKSFLMKII